MDNARIRKTTRPNSSAFCTTGCCYWPSCVCYAQCQCLYDAPKYEPDLYLYVCECVWARTLLPTTDFGSTERQLAPIDASFATFTQSMADDDETSSKFVRCVYGSMRNAIFRTE